MDLFDEIYTNIDSGNLSSTAFTGTSGGKFVLQTSPTINTSLTLAGATFTQSNASSGTAVSYSLSNTSNTASSDAKQIISVGGSSAGDAFTNWNVSGTTDWVAGIDNSTGNDEWRLQKAAALTSDYLIGCSQGGSGASNTVAIINSFDVADSQALLQISVGGTSAGDAITTYSIGSTTYWTTGIDNSDNDYWKLQKASVLSTSDYLLKANQGGSGGENFLQVFNSNNTASSDAYFGVLVAGTSAGDPFIYLGINSGTSWHIGNDNSDSDTFKIGTGTTVGTNTYFSIDTNGRVYLTPGTTQGLQITSANSEAIYSVVTKSSASSVLGHTLGISNPSTSGSASATALSVYSIAAGSGISYGLRVSVNGGTNNYAFDLSLSSSHAAGFRLAKFDTSQGTTAALGAYVGKMPFLHGSSTYYFPFYA